MVMSRRVGMRRAGVGAVAAYGARSVGNYVGKKIFNAVRPSNKRSGSSSSNNVTFQHDYAHIYGRKRSSRRVRNRARKSARRFENQIVRTLGQKTWNRTDTFSSGTVTPTSLSDAQSIFDIGMFGAYSSTSGTWGDLYQIATVENLLATTGKLHFKSCCMDVQIRNSTSSFEDPLTPTTIVVDLYTVYSRREGFNPPGLDWTSAMTDQATLAGTPASPRTLNTTPFDGPGFGSSWLIAKKMRYRIAPGNSVYLQLREHKRMMFHTGRMEWDATTSSTRIKMFKGMTRGYMFVIRSDTPVTLAGPIKSMAPFSYDIIYTKNYKYARQVSDADAQGFNP